ncbi:hypothetical protein ACFVVX_08985 [Kitasatospora sp. NPDC058170]|uniref:hypothetical protein n=1 Tax=Kitasatospora sp. NPDC058170 TaxID=3346364 RepID=UPI0036DF2C67
MPLHLVGADPLGGPATVWLNTDTGALVIKGLESTEDERGGRPVPEGMRSVTLPDRMKPIILEAMELARVLGLD